MRISPFFRPRLPMPVVGEKMSLGPLHGRQRHRPRHADFPLRFVASNATSLRAVRCAVMTRGPASDTMPPRAPSVEQRISASMNRPARGESSVLGSRGRSSHRHRHADFPLRFVASHASSLRAVRCAVMTRGPASDAMPPRAPRVEQRISASINRPARGESSVLGTRRRSSHRHRHADFPLRFVASRLNEVTTQAQKLSLIHI